MTKILPKAYGKQSCPQRVGDDTYKKLKFSQMKVFFRGYGLLHSINRIKMFFYKNIAMLLWELRYFLIRKVETRHALSLVFPFVRQ